MMQKKPAVKGLGECSPLFFLRFLIEKFGVRIFIRFNKAQFQKKFWQEFSRHPGWITAMRQNGSRLHLDDVEPIGPKEFWKSVSQSSLFFSILSHARKAGNCLFFPDFELRLLPKKYLRFYQQHPVEAFMMAKRLYIWLCSAHCHAKIKVQLDTEDYWPTDIGLYQDFIRSARYYQRITDQNFRMDVRRRFMEKYRPLVRNVASRLAIGFPKSVEMSELQNVGMFGLQEALDGYKIQKGVKLETYAVTRIRGAILDNLRKLDLVPRSVRTRARTIETAIEKMTAELGYTPNKAELAQELGWELSDLYKVLDETNKTILLSLDEMIYREDDNRQVPRIETVENPRFEDSALGDMLRAEQEEAIFHVLRTLSEQAKMVIYLYYHEELTLKEIGQIMSISESRVSQIHTKAIGDLKLKYRELLP